MPRATPDNANPLAVFTTRELLTNRAMARRRRKASALVARIDAELDRRRALKADRLFGGLPPIPALDETGWRGRQVPTRRGCAAHAERTEGAASAQQQG